MSIATTCSCVQGPGRRAWRIQSRRFVAGPGDLLYLPPGVRHDGVALEHCFTYSVGFRAPRGAELGAAFLDWLHERGLPDAELSRPCGCRRRRKPGRIPRTDGFFCRKLLRRIRWSSGDVERFLGEYLSEPKAHVVFEGGGSGPCTLHVPWSGSIPRRASSTAARASSSMARASQSAAGTSLRLYELADRRMAQGARLARARLGSLISRWQRQGYVNLEKS